MTVAFDPLTSASPRLRAVAMIWASPWEGRLVGAEVESRRHHGAAAEAGLAAAPEHQDAGQREQEQPCRWAVAAHRLLALPDCEERARLARRLVLLGRA